LPVAATLAVSGLLLSGCGGKKTEGQLFPAGVSTVGTIAQQTAAQPVIKDITDLTGVIGKNPPSAQLYSMLNRAATEKDIDKDVAMIRLQLPLIVSHEHAYYTRTLPRLRAVQVRTQLGRKLQQLQLQLLAGWEREMPVFAADVAAAKLVYGRPMHRFGAWGTRASREFSAQLLAIVRSAPAAQQQAIAQAIKQEFGP